MGPICYRNAYDKTEIQALMSDFPALRLRRVLAKIAVAIVAVVVLPVLVPFFLRQKIELSSEIARNHKLQNDLIQEHKRRVGNGRAPCRNALTNRLDSVALESNHRLRVM